ncbi:ATP-binding protein, partial [Pedobacter suwonensis]
HNVQSGKFIIELSKSALVVSNTGKDFDAKDRLFDRFSKSSESEGMGLGLAITKQVCNLYGYEISYKQINKLHIFSVFFDTEY